MANAIKISKPGFDVANTTENNLIFSSDYPLLKIHKQGSGRITTDGDGAATFVIPHDVGKIPMYFVKGEVTTDGFSLQPFLRQYPFSTYLGLGVFAYHIVKPFVDRIEVRFDIMGMVGQEFKFIYQIFEDPVIL
jgi:hypothetical protein